MDGKQEREELYLKFKQSEAEDDYLFDESDLVEIFDLATDRSEEAVRVKVINYATRFYPDSIYLKERGALLFYDLEDFEEAARIVAKLPQNSFIGTILRLRISSPPQDVIIKSLDNLIENCEELEDEWILQITGFADDSGLYDWIISNIEKIRSKTSFPQLLLYDVVGIALERKDFDTALRYMEELTVIEPFNGEFWEMLSDIYYNPFFDFDKAENAVDFALAINPHSFKALMLKSKILTEKGADPGHILPYLDKAISLNPDELDAIVAKSLFLAYIGRFDDAIMLLNDTITNHPFNLTVLDYLLKLTDGNINHELLEKVFNQEQLHDEETMMNIALDSSMDGKHSAAAILIKYYDRFVGLSYRKEYFYIYYKNGDFNEVISLYDKLHIKEDVTIGKIDLIYILSLLKLGKKRGIMAKIYNMIDNLKIEDFFLSDMNSQFERFAIRHCLEVIKDQIKGNGTPDFSQIDPFH